VVEVSIVQEPEANIYNSNGYSNLMNAIQKCDLNLVEKYLSEPGTNLNDYEDTFKIYGYFGSKHVEPINTLDIAYRTLNQYKKYYSALYRIKNENKSMILLNGKLLKALKNNDFTEIHNLDYYTSYFYDSITIDNISDLIKEPLLNINIYKPDELALEMAKKAKIIYDLLVNSGAKHSKYYGPKNSNIV
jgi:hypothetical protein